MTTTSTFAQTAITKVQGYWNNRPCNIRHSTKPVGTKEYFDEVEARKYRVEPHIPGFAEFAKWKGKRVLEIGCGLGTDTMNFARAGAQVTALDLSDKSLELARARAKVMGLEDRITFMQCNAEELDSVIGDQKFDLIYSFGVIHHTPHPEAVLEKIHKHLVPGGTFKIMMYHRRSWKVFWILMSYGKMQFWKLNELIATHSEAETGCPVTYSYSRREMADLLRKHQLTPVSVQADHIFPFRIPDYVKYQYVKVWYFRWMPQGLFRAFEKCFGWHLCATAVAK